MQCHPKSLELCTDAIKGDSLATGYSAERELGSHFFLTSYHRSDHLPMSVIIEINGPSYQTVQNSGSTTESTQDTLLKGLSNPEIFCCGITAEKQSLNYHVSLNLKTLHK